MRNMKSYSHSIEQSAELQASSVKCQALNGSLKISSLENVRGSSGNYE